MSIAAMLYPDGVDEQKFWVSQARNAFMAFSLYLFENWQDMKQSGFPGEHGTPTLGAIYRLSSGDGTELKAFLQSLPKREFQRQRTWCLCQPAVAGGRDVRLDHGQFQGTANRMDQSGARSGNARTRITTTRHAQEKN